MDGPSATRPRGGSTLAAVAFDLGAVATALAMSSWLRSLEVLEPLWDLFQARLRPGLSTWDENESALLLFQALTVPSVLFLLGQYRLMRDPRAEWSFNRVMVGVMASTGALLAMLFVLRIRNLPRGTLVLDFLILVVLTSTWRYLYQKQVMVRHERGEDLRNVLIVGAGPLEQRVASFMVADVAAGRRVVGFLAREPVGPLLALGEQVREGPRIHVPQETLALREAIALNARQNPRHLLAVVGSVSEQDLREAVDGLGVEEVHVGPGASSAEVHRCLKVAQERGIDVHLIPDHHVELGVRPRPWQMGPFTLLDVHRPPISRVGRLAKRALDVVGGVVGLVLSSPLLLACAIAIKLEDPRVPVFYRGRRVGLKGRHFRQWKLSTMVADADKYRAQMEDVNAREGPWFKVEEKDDPRISKVGRFLRKYSLNDLPQFLNVIRGDMSLVGPRPLAADEVGRFIDFDVKYHRIFDVKPGITGLWQIGDRENPSFEYRVEKDFEYIQTWSVWLDLKVLVLTPVAMLKGEM